MLLKKYFAFCIVLLILLFPATLLRVAADDACADVQGEIVLETDPSL